MTSQEKLQEYEQILKDIVHQYDNGGNFVKTVLIAIMVNQDSKSRNSYIADMGHHFWIDSKKVERILELIS